MKETNEVHVVVGASLGRRFRGGTIFDAAEVIEARGGVLAPIDPR